MTLEAKHVFIKNLFFFCATHQPHAKPFPIHFYPSQTSSSLSDCLLKSNFMGIFQINFFHAHINLNSIGNILTCFDIT